MAERVQRKERGATTGPSLADMYDTYKAAKNVGGYFTGGSEAAASESSIPSIADVVGGDSPLLSSSAGGAQGGWGLMGGGGGAGPYALGAAGAYGLYDLFSGTKAGTRQGALQGAASGAALGTAIMPGIGTAIGAGVGGVGGLISVKSRTREEQHQRDALIAQGINVPINETAQDGKAWELNEKFRQSRNEADLTGKDIMDASDFYARIQGYDKLDAAKREAIGAEALKRGLVREKLGKINVNFNNPDFQKFVEGQMTMPDTSSAQSASERKKARVQSRRQATLAAMYPEMTSIPQYDMSGVKL